MALSIELPEDVQTALESSWEELSKHVREKLAIEGYEKGLLSLAQVRRLLCLSTRWDAQVFLGKNGVEVFDFDPDELDREAAAQRKVTSGIR